MTQEQEQRRREFWEFVERTAEEVRTWPKWKRGWYAEYRNAKYRVEQGESRRAE